MAILKEKYDLLKNKIIDIWKRVIKDKLFNRASMNVLLTDRTVHFPQLMGSH